MDTESLEAILARGNDSAMLRLTLGSRYFEAGELERALPHAEAAVELDSEYTAAWRLLGNVQAGLGRSDEAAASYRQGIAIAEKRGDRQAAKEMQVFLRRLEARPK